MTQRAKSASAKAVNMTTDEIDKAVEERRAQVRAIVAFIEKVSTKIGKMISSHESSMYTHSVWEVQFGEFKWLWDAGLGLGLDRVILWRRPSSGNPVLVVEYFTTRNEEEKYNVKTFSSLPGWFDEFSTAMKRKDEILREMDEKAKAETRHKQEEDELRKRDEEKRKRLLEEAARLNL